MVVLKGGGRDDGECSFFFGGGFKTGELGEHLGKVLGTLSTFRGNQRGTSGKYHGILITTYECFKLFF